MAKAIKIESCSICPACLLIPGGSGDLCICTELDRELVLLPDTVPDWCPLPEWGD